MFVAKQVEVTSEPEVRSLRFIADACHLIIVMVGHAIAYLQDREVLVVKIDPQRPLHFPIVAHGKHGRPHNVERDSEPVEQRDGVLLDSEKLALSLYGQGSGKQQQEAKNLR